MAERVEFTDDMRTIDDWTVLTIDGQTFEEWSTELFEFEVCCECGGDVEDHEPRIVIGHWFALCSYFFEWPDAGNDPTAPMGDIDRWRQLMTRREA